MNELYPPCTQELLRDLDVNVFSSVKSKEIDHFSTYIDMNEVESYALQAFEQGPLNFKK